MTIQVTCQGCGKQYAAKDELAGKAVRCKNCGSTVRVPQPEVDLAKVDLSDLGEIEAPSQAQPLPPVRPAKAATQAKLALAFAKLGRWKIPVVAAAAMLVLAIPGLLSLVFAGLAVFIGLGVSAGLLLCGMGLLLGRVFQLASKEGSGAVLQVVFWTRGGRRFVYSHWREYGVPALFLLQGALLFGLTVLVIALLTSVGPLGKPIQARAPAPPRELTAEELAQQERRQEEQSKAIEAEAKRHQQEMDAHIRRQREHLEARTAEMRKRAGRPPEERKLDMINRFGAENVVTIYVEPVPGNLQIAVVTRIRELAGTTNLASSLSDGRLCAITAPVPQLSALADKIDFGEVTEVDEAKRTITVAADPEKLR